jgi:crossover junction endodeoxyribonuclease RuvC
VLQTFSRVSLCAFTRRLALALLGEMGITPQQFRSMQERMASPRRTVSPVGGSGCVSGNAGVSSAPGRAHKIVLGIDPSLRGTGYGIVRNERNSQELIAEGTIHCPASWERSRCLARILQTIREVIKAHAPAVCVIEGLFYAQNLQTALIMGEARGAALAAVAESGLDVYEIAPRKVKQAVVGYGAAEKSAVAKMVQRVLKLEKPPAPDAADALALALAFSQEFGRFNLKIPKKI